MTLQFDFQCDKLKVLEPEKVQKIHEITFQIKICVERVICQDIAVVFSKVKKYTTLQCLVKLHFLQKYFFRKK